ncbi:MAG: domain containing protein [Planctomycetaceae bacterium]|nr:domain containing protein [Planctomycetaceae bacterium]
MRPSIREHRCPGCEIRKPLCFCALIPRIELQTRLIVLMHSSEEVLTSNSARLAVKALTNSELRIHGRKSERMSTAGLAGAVRPLLLYPSANAVELTPEFVARLAGPATLIVPDSSWRQAQRFVRREPALLGIPHVKLPEGAPSEYRLRHQPNDTSLCTLEAIARALGLLESSEAQASLETVLNVMVERVLWSRGKLPANQCTSGDIPRGAFIHVNGPVRLKRQQTKGD